MSDNKYNDPGLKVIMAYDSAAGKPSFTLLFAYVAHVLAVCSLILYNIIGDHFLATTATCTYAIVCTILYIFRKLNKAKFDLKDQSFDLESDDKGANGKT